MDGAGTEGRVVKQIWEGDQKRQMNRPSGPEETNSARNEKEKPDHKGRQGRRYQRGPQGPHSPGSPGDKDLGNYLQWAAAKQHFYTRGGQ